MICSVAATRRLLVNDALGGNAFLRTTWHGDRQLMTVSLWRENVCVGVAHVDGPNRLDLWPGRLDTKQMRGLAGLDTAPELLFGDQKQMLVERIGRNGHLDPFSAPGDD